jgi:hypothetical protein
VSNIDQRLGNPEAHDGCVAGITRWLRVGWVAAMPSVARVTYIPLRTLAVNVIAIYSRSRRKRRTPDTITTVDPRVERLYSLDELTELRRNVLRYARTFPPGYERNQHLQVAVSLRALFKREQWLRDHVRSEP